MSKAKEYQMRAGPAWVNFISFEPQWKEFTGGGRIIRPERTVTGKASHTNTIWGRVYLCGSMGNRASIEPFAVDVERREGFPLPHGTWVICRQANHHTAHNDFQIVQTSDVIDFWPPSRSWDSIEEELANAWRTLPPLPWETRS